MYKIAILGSTGFVGRNLLEDLSGFFVVKGTSRNDNENDDSIWFDLEEKKSWENLSNFAPDFIINATGYGVVKYQEDINQTININYLYPLLLKEFLDSHLQNYLWIQIGSAFEYSLDIQALSEDSPCIPKTAYGLTKWLFTNYLLQSAPTNYLIIRPFAMFGPFEDRSKLIPTLINAQLNNVPIKLSSGNQSRDYFFVKDLSFFIKHLINNSLFTGNGSKIINVGTGHAKSLIEIAKRLSQYIPGFKDELWQWGSLPQRTQESPIFFNASDICHQLGFQETPFEESCNVTLKYYISNDF